MKWNTSKERGDQILFMIFFLDYAVIIVEAKQIIINDDMTKSWFYLNRQFFEMMINNSCAYKNYFADQTGFYKARLMMGNWAEIMKELKLVLCG